MAYSMDQLLIRNNRRGNLAACWLAATKKQFIGSGSSHLTKNEVLKVDINAACNGISKGLNSKQGNPRSNFYISSQLTFGALKVFQTQLIDLEDEIEKLYTEVLVPKTQKKIEKEMTTKKSKDVILDYYSEIPIVDLEKIFPQDKVDKNQLVEDIIVPPVQADILPTGFGDLDNEELNETTFDNMNKELAAMAVKLDSNTISNLPDSTIETPSKRKSNKVQDETPTKKKRISDLSSKSIRRGTPSPQARRLSFDIPAPTVEPTVFLQNESDEVLNDPTIPHEVMDANIQQSAEQILIQPQPLLTEVELQSNECNDRNQLPITSDLYQLSDLDKISTSYQKMKQKKITVFDEYTQINITQPKSVMEHAKKFQLINPPDRVSANLLLSMPSTGNLRKGLKSHNKNIFSWSSNLLNLYTEIIKRPCTDTLRTSDKTISLIRHDFYVNKDFRGRISEDNFTSESYDLLGEKSNEHLTSKLNSLGRDTNPIPQPLTSITVPHEEYNEQANEELQSPQTRFSKVPEILKLTPSHDAATAASPRQKKDSQSLMTEAAVAPDLYLEVPGIPEAIQFASATAVSPRQERGARSIMKEAAVAPDSVIETKVQHEESTMNAKEFFKLLERLSRQLGSGKLLLDEILSPEQVSAMVLLTHLYYIFICENEGKLELEQERAYEPIYLTLSREAA